MVFKRIDKSNTVLVLVIVAQLLATSLWFLGNAILPLLGKEFPLSIQNLSWFTLCVHLGFVSGSLCIAKLGLADRYSPVRIFTLACILAAFVNTSLIILPINSFSIFTTRILSGVCLAGIYPIGIKLVADWRQKNLGSLLSWFVAALVAGSSLSFAMRYVSFNMPWQELVLLVTCALILAALLVGFFVNDGPYRQAPTAKQVYKLSTLLQEPALRKVAFGYFGHMWELYSFWALIPLIVMHYNSITANNLNPNLLAFLVMFIGALACVVGGYWAKRKGNQHVAFICLAFSGVCCLLAAFYGYLPKGGFLFYLLIWGATVIADSPLFSSEIARLAKPTLSGSTLVLCNALGFGISMLSLVTVQILGNYLAINYLLLILCFGPLSALCYSFLSSTSRTSS